jgi:PAS domain S-box-containing protein
LSLATRAGGVGIWDLDVVNDTLTWDDQMFALYGIRREQFGGAYETWQAGVLSEDLRRGDIEVQMALNGEKEFDTEFRVLWPDGSIHNIRALAHVQRDASGKPLRMIGTNWDITEQKNVERELQQSEEKYRLLIENSHDIIYTINSSGILTFVSPGWTALLGHPVSRVVGKPFQQFVHPEDIDQCVTFLQRTFETGERQTAIEYRVQHTDGSWRWHTSNAVPLKDKDGMVIAFEGSASDVTERKLAEAALTESNNRVVSFIKEAAMRLKNPLEVVEQNLTTVVNDVEAGGFESSNVSLQLRIQMKNVEQIRKNIIELNTAIVKHSGEITAPEKKFLTE